MKRFTFAILMLATLLPLGAANKVTTVEQVTGTVTLTEDVDYHITSTEPFATTGSIDIINTDHAVVIFDNVKPSLAKKYLAFISIDGEKAVNGTNCQIRIFNRGAIILPYGNSVKMLTAYTEENFGGESYNDYRIGNSGGFMLTLKDSELNNKIRSFKLKRGYMVTFSIRKGGYGYSRCFIADTEDLEMAKLPDILSGRISSYRIFKWQNINKRGYAGADANVNRLLNSTWFYGWNADAGNSYDDYEYVPQHHHEGWPSIADVGKNGNSAHALGNNEPDNKADDKEQDLDPVNVLKNWDQMMATGKRLGSPAVSGNKSWLKEFIDSIDKRGWRVDFVAVHDYNLNDRSSKIWNVNDYSSICKGRPVWLTEMNYGANWTSWPGSNTDGNAANYKIEVDHFGPTIDGYNESDIVERYGFYNWVENCRKVYNDEDASLRSKNYLTPMGEYYASVDPGLAYNPKKEFIPRTPPVTNPRAFTATYNPVNNNCTLRWTDENGELLDSIFIEVKNGSGEWERLANIDISDTKYTYNYSYKNAVPGNYAYRIHTIDFNKANHYSAETYNIITNTESLNDGNIQVGTVTTQTSNESYNFFAAPFDEVPAVVFGSVSNYNSKAGLVERINTNYTKDDKYNAVTSSIIPLTYGSETSFYRGTEYSSFLATKPGTGKIGSLSYEAAITEPVQVGDTLDYTFVTPFNDIPVVMVTPIYTTKTYPLLWRVFDVTTTGFRVVLQRQAGVASNVAKISAKLALFAIETGKQQLEDGTTLIAGNGDFTFTSSLITQKDIEYGDSLNEPKVLVQLQSLNRKVAGNLRTQINAPGATKTAVRLHLDASDNANNAVSARNPVEERLGWIVVGKPFNIDDAIRQPKSVLHQLVAYPSVVTTTFGVRDDDATKASVYSSNGQLLKTMELTQGQATIDISSLPAGIYLVRTNAQHSTKIIKK